MALKDWERLSSNEWQKNGDNKNWKILWFGYFANGYNIVLSDTKRRKVLSVRHNKSQALKFARNYMRKH